MALKGIKGTRRIYDPITKEESFEAVVRSTKGKLKKVLINPQLGNWKTTPKETISVFNSMWEYTVENKPKTLVEIYSKVGVSAVWVRKQLKKNWVHNFHNEEEGQKLKRFINDFYFLIRNTIEADLWTEINKGNTKMELGLFTLRTYFEKSERHQVMNVEAQLSEDGDIQPILRGPDGKPIDLHNDPLANQPSED